MKTRKKQFAVIGLGRFGESLLRQLIRNGYEVLAIDNDETKVNDIVHIATHVVQADSTDERVLEKIGIAEFDAVVVAIGQDMQVNILTALILKEMGVKRIIAKAQNAQHGKVLEKIGIDTIIYPERDMAVKLARSMTSNNIVDQIDMPDDYSLMELLAPHRFIGKSLDYLNVRKIWNITVLAIKRNNKLIVTPSSDELILKNDLLIIIGKNTYINKVSELD